MKKYIQLFQFLLLGVFILTSCSNDDDTTFLPSTEKGKRVAIEVSIGTGAHTKTTMDAGFKTLFDEGDKVGIFVVQRKIGEVKALAATGNCVDNAQLPRQADGSWKLSDEKDIYYAPDGEVLDFYAYYPYRENVTDATQLDFLAATDQRTNSMENDFLWAKVTNIRHGETVGLNFAHLMAMVQIEVEKGVDIPDFDDTFSAILENVYTQVAFDWNEATATSAKGDITMHKVADATNTYRAFVPAQTVNNEEILFSFAQTNVLGELTKFVTAKNTELKSGNVSLFHHQVHTKEFDPNHIYAVSDLYPYIGEPIGVVYEVSNGGKHGKVVAMDEGIDLRWGPGKEEDDQFIDFVDESEGDPNSPIRSLDDGRTATRYLINKRKE